jgi:hypothetical protein
VVEELGGPCRGRTYGPLIKSEAEGVAQFDDDIGNTLRGPGTSRQGYLSHFVPVRLTSTPFVSSANTVLTPASIGTPPGGSCGGVMASTHGINKRLIGEVMGIRNEPLAWDAAENRARDKMMKTLSTYTAYLMRDYAVSTARFDLKQIAEEQHIEEATKTFAAATLSGARPVDR